jgi:ADP-glucose pyrophosphorylase
MTQRNPKARVLAMALAGGEGTRLSPLTLERSKPPVPFGGRYRIVDFALSNLINSGIYSIYLLVQYKSQSLIEHVYRMDVGQMVDFHRASNAHVTVAALPVPIAHAARFGVIDAAGGRIRAFLEKPGEPPAIPGDPHHAYASMGDYLFDTDDYVVVRRGARLKRVIVDRYNTMDPHCRIGYDIEADRRRWFVNDSGIVVVAKGGYGAVTDRYH